MLLSCFPQTEIKLKQTSKDQDKRLRIIKDILLQCATDNYDTVDNPDHSKDKFKNESINKNYFEIMKHERNRINSFDEKWPVTDIKSTKLAEAGFFYLQTDDKVQCAFCKLVLCSWEKGDDPLEEHKKNSPNCPFLIPSIKVKKNQQVTIHKNPNYCSEYTISGSTFGSKKPVHPNLVDIQKRLHTFKEWSNPHISIKDLAECGYFYTGTKDFTACFFCGNVQGFWEPTDIPLKEHERLFPDCGYLRILKNQPTFKKTELINSAPTKQKFKLSLPVKQAIITELMESEIVKEAKEIFPQSLVENVIYQRMTKTGEPFTSLTELCEEILEVDENMSANESAENIGSKLKNMAGKREDISKNSEDVIICQICMVKEKGVVFLPCGHLVSCSDCSTKVSKCPICRSTIENRIRTYLS